MSATESIVRRCLSRQLVCAVMLVIAVLVPSWASAQEALRPAAPAPVVVPFSGQLTTATGEPRTGSAVITISLYAEAESPAPIWAETQTVTVDASGRYSVQFGATQADGLPAGLFAAGAARWIGVSVDGGAEGARVMLLSVPYAARAAVADSLGGRPAADFVLADNLASGVRDALLKPDGTAGTTGTASLDGGVHTTNRIPKFINNTGTVSDSVIAESVGRIGIGTTTPGATLDVWNSGIRVNSVGAVVNGFVDAMQLAGWETLAYPNGTNRLVFGGYRSLQWDSIGLFTNGLERIRVDATGRVGIGTTTPLASLEVFFGGIRVNSGGTVASGFIDGVALAGWDALAYKLGSNTLVLGGYRPSQWDSVGLFTAGSEKVRVTTAGSVGIGTTNPLARLHVAGDVLVDGNIAAKYQDVAEWVDSSEPLEAGTIVVIDTAVTNRVSPASRAYDSRVAGAISAQPGIVLGESGPGRQLVAQSGRVRVKADARYGAIRPGDLLVSSPTRGHAMRSRPLSIAGQFVHRPGTIIGKALEALPKGRGEILILVTLQ